jgi:hypothetical protein
MKKKKKNPHITLRGSDVKRMKKETTHDAVVSAFAIFLMVMHDKWGFGAIRLNRLFKHICELSELVGDGYVSVAEIKKTLREEMNIIIGSDK